MKFICLQIILLLSIVCNGQDTLISGAPVKYHKMFITWKSSDISTSNGEDGGKMKGGSGYLYFNDKYAVVYFSILKKPPIVYKIIHYREYEDSGLVNVSLFHYANISDLNTALAGMRFERLNNVGLPQPVVTFEIDIWSKIKKVSGSISIDTFRGHGSAMVDFEGKEDRTREKEMEALIKKAIANKKVY